MRLATSDVIAMFSMLVFQEPSLSKADVDAAFRRVPVREDHKWAAGVTWLFENEPWFATHIGMPFGAAASGIAWHKVGRLIQKISHKLLGLPLWRYVDDYFAVDRCVSGDLLDDIVLAIAQHFHIRPETVEHGLSTFVRLVRALLGPDAIADNKVSRHCSLLPKSHRYTFQ